MQELWMCEGLRGFCIGAAYGLHCIYIALSIALWARGCKRVYLPSSAPHCNRRNKVVDNEHCVYLVNVACPNLPFETRFFVFKTEGRENILK